MKKSRREFLKIAGITILGAGAGSLINGVSVSSATESAHKSREPGQDFFKGAKALTAKRWGMVIDTNKLTDEICENMRNVCHKDHNVPDFVRKFGKKEKNHEIKWIWETGFEHAFPGKIKEFAREDLEELPISVLCNHCENPPCVRACPTQATFKREDGIVMMDFHRCIGCRFCMAACPYGSRSFNFRDPRAAIYDQNPDFPTRTKGVVEKCEFCAERLAVGKLPLCVEASEGALVFGDLEDPESEIRTLLAENYTIRRKPQLGTNPSVFYII